MMKTTNMNITTWANERIHHDEISRYLGDGDDFIPVLEIENLLDENRDPDPIWIRDIFNRALSLETLLPHEVAALINLKDHDLCDEMAEVALRIKKKVYDNRIVTFAPLYTGTLCVNNCAYCGFRTSNTGIKRRLLTGEEICRETEVLAGKIGHKRLIVVYGEHPSSGIDYMLESLRCIYSVKVKTRNGYGDIRRANLNAPVMPIEELRLLHQAGIGTYQVFQETYHRPTYKKMHPPKTIKGNYHWRLYCMHRAFEAGIDDVGIGVLFGLYDWKFEVMGLLYHARELEKLYGIGPHTISFPRLEPAIDTPFNVQSPYMVSDRDFLHLVAVLRLAVPYTGMIVTARESAQMRMAAINRGCTQTDASSRIGVGAYSLSENGQKEDHQQFLLGDTRTLDEVIRELAQMGYITSFCTAGYRCGRTGKIIMDLLKSCTEGKFCKLNAVLTFREWLDDFASQETIAISENLIKKEIEEIREKLPDFYTRFTEYYERIKAGERDLYF